MGIIYPVSTSDDNMKQNNFASDNNINPNNQLKYIKSKFVLQLIFHNIKKMRQLKLVRYNKNLQDKLELDFIEFTSIKCLKEFGKKYNLMLTLDDREINLKWKYGGNELLDYLSKINFNNIQILDISENKISDISPLLKMNMKNLREINLKCNEITNIKII